MRSLITHALTIVFLATALLAEDIQKISDIEIDTMKFLSSDDIQKRYDPTKDATGHLKSKPLQDIEVGFSDTGGNTRTTSLNAKYILAHQTRIRTFAPMFYTFETSAFLARDDGKRSAEEYKALFNARQPLPHQWLGYLSLGWLRNSFQNFDAKVDLSIGTGKVLYQSKRISFVVKVGPAANYEKYTNGGERNYASLNEYIEYQRKIRNDIVAYLKAGAKENFEKMHEDYEINTLAGIEVEMGKRVHGVAEYNYMYDNTPSEGYGKTDTKLVVRLGYRF